MSSKTYDAIVIGGGGNGLCVAAYMARAGLKTAIFERTYEEGGGFWSWEYVPGFRFNHAHFHEFNEWMPFLQDFELGKLGYRAYYPEVQLGAAYRDGRPPLVLYSPTSEENFKRSHKTIAHYSKHDADTWVECRKKACEMSPMIGKMLYSPPPVATVEMPDPVLGAHMGVLEDFGVPGQYAYATPKDVIDYLFESTEMRGLLYKQSEDWIAPLRTSHMGFSTLSSLFCIGMNWRLASGGTHTLAHSMVMAAVKEGVDFYEQGDVRKVLLDNGRAVGVKLADGREFHASKLVASNADLKQTLLGMVGEENLSPRWAKQTKHFKYGPTGCITLLNAALHEAPDYKSAKYNPDINRAFCVMIGCDTEEEVYKHTGYTDAGIPMTRTEEFPWLTSVPSLHAPGYAPEGKHTLYSGGFFPKVSELTEQEWAEVEEVLEDKVLSEYGKYAPNMTKANIIGSQIVTPLGLEREIGMPEGDYMLGRASPDQLFHNRPFPEAAQYRAEVDGLYLCSSGQYPIGGLSTCSGYNAYKIIAEDLDLPYKPWESHPRGF
jgi:phytoene dehydrogenase-like protein